MRNLGKYQVQYLEKCPDRYDSNYRRIISKKRTFETIRDARLFLGTLRYNLNIIGKPEFKE